CEGASSWKKKLCIFIAVIILCTCSGFGAEDHPGSTVHIVNKGTKWQFRVTADYKNLIREKSENNNQKTQNWPLRMIF
ncbi:MAG: hypothetical protein MUP70_10425, partial [Candidatus Aminicenantes bacterium]|nr:hypothetical protein [Candidatus Aminicenantes bacterium]